MEYVYFALVILAFLLVISLVFQVVVWLWPLWVILIIALLAYRAYIAYKLKKMVERGDFTYTETTYTYQDNNQVNSNVMDAEIQIIEEEETDN